SVMGRLERTELEVFVRFADLRARQTRQEQEPNNTLSGLTDEALRCLHCDCRALGNCDLQRYAQLYNANAARFKTTRRHFEQEYHPEGIVFERGKCILCGICVKLTELGGEKLGLTFLGRGFAARLAVPFGRPINKGLQKTMAECVKYCPTGALAFLEDSPPK
ncbi:MAG: hypothetical protein N3G20_02720, partial [Verrucomicrobiae bacterium]|nr:hypothetical protein [Verrucomicrobiae bacterium]